MTDIVDVYRSDGARLSVQVSGDADAPALFLLQGQASSHTWWNGLRHRYEDRFRTITMDYRGTGSTEAAGGRLTTGMLADDAAAVLEHLSIDQAHVYGTSMGGRVAQMLAAHHPERVRTLALACTSPGGPHAVERDSDVRRALSNPDSDARQHAMVELFYTPAWGTDPRRTSLFGDLTMTPNDRQRHLRMSAQHDAWDLLPTIGAPTLVLHGAEDRVTPSVNAEIIAERIPHADLHIHPTGRHGFFGEFAVELNRVLQRLWT